MTQAIASGPAVDMLFSVFDHYLFQTAGHPVAHLRLERRGALGAMSAELAAHIKSALLKRLQRS